MAGIVVAIAQQKGGAGKTTLAAHLAVAWAGQKRRVAVIDIDPQASLAAWHALREERFGKGKTGLDFAAIAGWRVAAESERRARDHDIVLVDSPPHAATEARLVVRAVMGSALLVRHCSSFGNCSRLVRRRQLTRRACEDESSILR